MTRQSPADYRSKVRKPADFDSFWNDVLKQASTIPLEPEILPDPLRTSDDVEVFQSSTPASIRCASLPGIAVRSGGLSARRL